MEIILSVYVKQLKTQPLDHLGSTGVAEIKNIAIMCEKAYNALLLNNKRALS